MTVVNDVPDARGRLVWLDNLKVVLTAAIIVAHAGMTYSEIGTWIYEEPSVSDALGATLGVLIGVGIMFGLGLFFLMAGLLTPAPLARLGSRRFVRSRLARLGGPLAAYALLVWPVLGWLTDRAEGDPISLAGHYRRVLSAERRWSIGTGPLWFVAILLVLSCSWALWRAWRPPSGPPAPEGARRTMVMAMGAIAVSTFALRIPFPIDSAQFLDLHLWLWPQSAALFVLGALGSEQGWLVPAAEDLRRWCRRLAAGSLAALLVMIVASSGPDPFQGGVHPEAAGFALVEGVFSVSVCVVILDRFRRHHDTDCALRQTLARSAYVAFVVQGPVLVLVALAMRDLDLAGDLKFAVLAVTGVVACFGIGAAATTSR